MAIVKNSREIGAKFTIPVLSFYLLINTILSRQVCGLDSTSTSTPLPLSQKLLLISFDGFRWNYLDRTKTPNFDRIRKNGVQAVHGLTNAFITKTFPNHFTLVTGQWEEDHGIVANYMYDPALNRSFSPHDVKANTEAAWFDQGGEPIWVTNQLQKDGKSCVIMWVGAGAPVKNVHPTKFMAYDADVKNETKVDTIIKWFKEDGCNLGLIYFNQPDKFGHIFGPESKQVTRMIGGLDKVIGYLLDRLEKEKLLQETNIIVTSDHGFSSTPVDKTIDLNELIDPNAYLLESSNPIAGIWPHEGYHDTVYQNLSLAGESVGHFTVYQKEDIPAHFHYTHNRRIPPIIVVADDHYSFTQGIQPWHEMGTHGYDNRLQDMHPFFIAMGPAFKSCFTVDTFQSVDVYPLMCEILGVKPAPNNGSMEIVRTLLMGNETASVGGCSIKRKQFGGYNTLRFLRKHNIGSIMVAILVLVGLATAALIAIHEVFKRKKERESAQVIMDDMEITIDEETIKKAPLLDTSNVPLLHDQDF